MNKPTVGQYICALDINTISLIVGVLSCTCSGRSAAFDRLADAPDSIQDRKEKQKKVRYTGTEGFVVRTHADPVSRHVDSYQFNTT